VHSIDIYSTAGRRLQGFAGAVRTQGGKLQEEIEMKKNRTRMGRTLICGAVLGLVTVASLSTASQAETGSVRVVFTKAGFIVGVGGGRGT